MDTQNCSPFEFATFWKTAARLQLETLGLMARRSQAYMALPAQIARCKTPDDLAAEQARFLEVAQRDYLARFESTLSAMSLPSVVDAARVKAVARQRDYLTVATPEATVHTLSAASPIAGRSVAGVSGKPMAQQQRRSA